MKNKVITYVLGLMLAIAVIPVINSIKFITRPQQRSEEWFSGSTLYNFDFALPFLGRLFYPFKISISPHQVMIGKEDWLYYLGDNYVEAYADQRQRPLEAEAITAKKIAHATAAWDRWLKSKGVNAFKLMVSPDKGSIYPEFMPDWANAAANSVTDTLLANVDKKLYVDTRPALIAAKAQYTEPLYYKTDTHWNSLGAWLAFQTFIQAIANTETKLIQLSDQQVRVSGSQQRQGGDLARFLRIPAYLQDHEVNINMTSRDPTEMTAYDYQTGLLKVSNDNELVAAPKRLLLVKSRHALNQKKVLWLRDSFGTAIAPYMAATFSETLQIQYTELNPDRLAKLVDTYKPDYVFITVVERHLRSCWFEKPPPSIL